MKLLVVLCVIFSVFISNCFADTAFAIWNSNSSAAVGIYDIPNRITYQKFILPNAHHLYPSNQYSTYNKNTKVISFLVNSTEDNIVHLQMINTDTWELSNYVVNFPTQTVLSIESSQSTSVQDLFIVLSNFNSLSNFIIGKIDPTTGRYSIYDTIQGTYTFGSASFDQVNNVFVVIMMSPSGAYIVNCYSTTGTKVSSDVYAVSNFAPGYSAIGNANNLVFVPKLAGFYFNLNIRSGSASSGNAQLFQLYAPSKSFRLLPVISNTCNINASGIVQSIDNNGARILYQFFNCAGSYNQQKYDLVGPSNQGVYPLTSFIINAWN